MAAKSKATNKESRDTLNWPIDDMLKLLKLLEEQIPHNDSLSFKSRASKIPWEKVSFDNYTEDECKQTWELISHRLRRFRLLKEMIDDAKIWVSRPWTNFYRKKASKTHPDKPKKPLTANQIFFIEQQSSMRKKHPNITIRENFSIIMNKYKALSAEEKAEYLKRSQSLKNEYLIKMKAFLLQYPAEATASDTKLMKGDIIKESAFKLYLGEQILSNTNSSDKPLDKLVKKYTKKWDQLSEEGRLVWIDCAKQNNKIENKLKIPKAKRSITSAYYYYLKKMMSSEEIHNLPPENRKKAISIRWKRLSKEEKDSILKEHTEALKASGVEVAVNGIKTKRKIVNNDPSIPNKKIKEMKNSLKSELVEVSDNKTEVTCDIFTKEPKQPPEEPIKLFKKDMRKKNIKFSSKQELCDAWDSLPKSEKKTFEKQIKQLKVAYLEEFEAFISSLSKKELKAFNKSKQIVADS